MLRVTPALSLPSGPLSRLCLALLLLWPSIAVRMADPHPSAAEPAAVSLPLGAGSALLVASDGADNWGEVIKLVASDGAWWDDFGASVAIAGHAIAAGAYMDDVVLGNDEAHLDQGSAYVYTRRHQADTFKAYLPAVLREYTAAW